MIHMLSGNIKVLILMIVMCGSLIAREPSNHAFLAVTYASGATCGFIIASKDDKGKPKTFINIVAVYFVIKSIGNTVAIFVRD